VLLRASRIAGGWQQPSLSPARLGIWSLSAIIQGRNHGHKVVSTGVLPGLSKIAQGISDRFNDLE
jgi:hypothetical protein